MALGIIDQILGPRCAKVSVPYLTDFTFRVMNIFSDGHLILSFRGKTCDIMTGERPLETLYNSVPRAWMFRS